MKILILICSLLYCTTNLVAQNRIVARNAYVKFLSKAPLENIEAINKSGVSVIDKSSGKLEFSVLLKGFSFEKLLMQEHFNENYVESDLYPKAIFKGTIQNYPSVDFNKKNKVSVTINGSLQLHGVTKEVVVTALFNIQEDAVVANCEFVIIPSDYNIAIPRLVKDKIASSIQVSVTATYR